MLYGPAPGARDWPGAPGSGAAGGGESLSHLAYLYDDQRDYLSYLSAFALGGLRNAEPVFVAVPGRKAALLRERLGAESHLLRYGAIAETGRNPARLIPELRAFIDEHRGRRVRYVSEAIWPGRSAAELCEATRHEALMNLAFASSAATIVCPYDIGELAPSVVGGAERTHPAFLRDGRTQSAAGYAGRGVVPAECEDALSAPPADAQVLAYETSLRPVRHLVASHGEEQPYHKYLLKPEQRRPQQLWSMYCGHVLQFETIDDALAHGAAVLGDDRFDVVRCST